MQYLVNAGEMKQYDRNTIEILGIPSLVLMERAALTVVEELLDGSFSLEHILVVCGSGNNGGDGFAVARLLKEKNIRSAVLFVGKEDSLTEDARIQKNICEKYGINIFSNCILDEYTCIVDALFGVGLSREIQGKYYDLIHQINHSKAEVLSVDIPSGISADTGEIMGIAIKAKKTVTFAFGKIGHFLSPGNGYCGVVKIRNIGITENSFLQSIPQCFFLEKPDLYDLPKRFTNSHKGSYGKALLIAGHHNMAGAACLAGEAAYRMGTGLVRIFTEECNRSILQQCLKEAVLSTYSSDEGVTQLKEVMHWPTASGIGPGFGTSQEKEEILYDYLLNGNKPLVIDADALNILAKHKEWIGLCKNSAVFTPHFMEMSRLTGLSIEQIKRNPIDICRNFAKKYHVICILKDARTLISDGERVCINLTGTNGMSSGGTGDVLTGIITGLLAQGMELFHAACIGVWIHGKAGEKTAELYGNRGMLAGDMIPELGKICTTVDEMDQEEHDTI